jgi:hypothetical protein
MALNEIRKPARRGNADLAACFCQTFAKRDVRENIATGAAG